MCSGTMMVEHFILLMALPPMDLLMSCDLIQSTLRGGGADGRRI